MKAKDVASNAPSEETSLDGRYGEIGISAVAAALRYNGDAKNPAYAPVVPKDDTWHAKRRAEMAAA